MNIFRTQAQTDEIQRVNRQKRIAKVLVPLKDNYAWEIAEVDEYSKRGDHVLWLLHIRENGTTRRVFGYHLKDLKLKTIKSVSESIVVQNRHVKLVIKNKSDVDSIGFYASLSTSRDTK